MLESYIIFTKAKQEDAYDALVINPDNKIREGTRTNFFFTDGTTIFTAPADNVLNGVTRSTLLQVLTDHNIPVEERELDASELDKYIGFFLTSTSSKIVPISLIDDTKIQIPEIIKRAIQVYNQFLQKYVQEKGIKIK